VCRDAPRPDPFRAPRRAAEGKGGAAWRRDRSHAQPRTGPFGPSMASMARTHPLPVASTGALSGVLQCESQIPSYSQVNPSRVPVYARGFIGFYGFKDSAFLTF